MYHTTQQRRLLRLTMVVCLTMSMFSSLFSQVIDSKQYNYVGNWYNWQGGRFINNLNIPKVTATTGRDTGGIRYSLADSSIYVWTGSQWRQVTGGGGSSYTFSNGLTESAGTVRLGGALTQATHIWNNTFKYSYALSGTDSVVAQTNGTGWRVDRYKTGVANNLIVGADMYFEVNDGSSQSAGFQFFNSFGSMETFFQDSRTVKTGLRYSTLDTTNWVTSTLVTKDYINKRLLNRLTAVSLNNVGTGYDVAVQGTDGVKRLQAGTNFAIDSTTTPNVLILNASGGGGSTDTTSLSNRIDDKISKIEADTTIAVKTFQSGIVSKQRILYENFRYDVPVNLPKAPNATDTLTIPTYDGSGQSVHPDVWYTPYGWNGYKYWMVMTPYGNGADSLENPSLVASNDRITWVVPAGVTNPISPAINYATGFHSDPDIIPPGVYDDSMRIIYRHTINRGTNASKVYVQSFAGTTVSTRSLAIDSSNVEVIVSPCVVEKDGIYTMYYIELLSSPNLLVKRTATNPNGPWSDRDTCTVVNTTGFDIWHINAAYMGDQLHMFINTTNLGASGENGRLYFAKSNDGENFTMGSSPILDKSTTGFDNNGIYRAAPIALSSNRYGLFYSAVDSSTVWNQAYTELYLTPEADSIRKSNDSIFLHKYGKSVYQYTHNTFNTLTGTTLNATTVAATTMTATTSITSPILYGGVNSGSQLTLRSTSNATKGLIYFGNNSVYDEVNTRLGINTASPQTALHVVGAIRGNNGFLDLVLQDGSGNQVFRGVRGTTGWDDGVSTQFFQVGNSSDNALFTAQSGSTFNRVGFSTSSFHVNTAFGSTAPVGLFDISSGSTKLFNVLSGGNVGIGQSAPASKLHVEGSFSTAYLATATGITLSNSHSVVNVTATGQTITLPTAVGITGRQYTIKLTASGTGTVATTSSQTIDGVTTYTLSAQYKYVTVTSDGANWIITANN